MTVNGVNQINLRIFSTAINNLAQHFLRLNYVCYKYENTPYLKWYILTIQAAIRSYLNSIPGTKIAN